MATEQLGQGGLKAGAKAFFGKRLLKRPLGSAEFQRLVKRLLSQEKR